MRLTVGRVAVGLYVALRYGAMLPYAEALYGPAGTLPEPSLNPFAVSALDPLLGAVSPTLILGAIVALALTYARGWRPRLVALLLVLGQALLFQRNQLTLNPAMSFVGLWLLGHALVPDEERRADALWWISGAAYTFSGLAKLMSPSWVSGDAGAFILASPLGRDHGLVQLLEGAPALLTLGTWAMLALEVAMLPLVAKRSWRPYVGLATVGMHLMLLLTVNIADITLGMLVFHAALVALTFRDVSSARALRSARAVG